jgi:hypothetical protein
MLYVDPSAGSIVLQAAVAAVFGGVLFAGRWWGAFTRGVRAGFGRLRRRP